MVTPFPFIDDTVLDAADLDALGTWDSTTWTTTLDNVTIGDGTETALFTRIGDGDDLGLIFYYYELVWGTTTSITGNVFLNYPFEGVVTSAAALTREGSMSSFCFFEDDDSTDYYGRLFRNTGNRGQVRVFDSSGTYVDGTNISNTIPFTWATGDRLIVSGYFRPGA